MTVHSICSRYTWVEDYLERLPFSLADYHMENHIECKDISDKVWCLTGRNWDMSNRCSPLSKNFQKETQELLPPKP
ncbi:MAG: hypothetical protein K1X28_02740 [Parachlamydiales bacterium]|nr:hypothetical protein [Parachlamydiales bacterium]